MREDLAYFHNVKSTLSADDLALLMEMCESAEGPDHCVSCAAYVEWLKRTEDRPVQQG